MMLPGVQERRSCTPSFPKPITSMHHTIVCTGGGSAGHVTPHIALIPAFQELGFNVHYIGQRTGIERELIAPLGIPYHAISAGKLRRYFDLKNVTDLARVAVGFCQALAILFRLRPAALFSKGGFVACPVVWAAWLLRIPVIIHESDLTPGLANRLSAPFATRICYSFPETRRYLRRDNAVLTGIPIRTRLLSGHADAGHEFCGFTDRKPVVLVMGGSLGAQAINAAVRSALADLRSEFNICHLCGAGHRHADFEGVDGYAQFEYVAEELPHVFALADVVISRAGATSLFEFLAARKPALLIPLPRAASRGDQIQNARSFERQGFSRVLPEEELTPDRLAQEVRSLYADREKLAQAMQQAEAADGISRVLAVVREVASGQKE